ncbi:MAG: ethanolamine ammonia-lyase reactivating factor EutA [Alphaproteobacteria bacterium]
MHEVGFDHLHPPREVQEEQSRTSWSADNVELVTVGIDIGSTTSHLMFARVHMQRLSEALSSRFVVVDRKILWRSPILLTPYTPGNLIDAAALKVSIDQFYEAAGFSPDDIDSGAVILTGEALKRGNARAIADLFSEESGKFVCASAGHNLESVMAAHGSGAVALSRGDLKTILNVDIGGGTTKLALVHDGRLLHKSAFAVGGRLVAFGEAGELVRIEGPARQIAEAAGIDLELGQTLTAEQCRRFVDTMADVLVANVLRRPEGDLCAVLALTDPLPGILDIKAVTFSGGVAEFVFQRETEDYADLGRLLAETVREALAEGRIPYPVYDTGQGIRATVIGASQFTAQVSGNTIEVSSPGLLPLRNVPVIHLNLSLEGEILAEQVADEIGRALAGFDISESETTVAIAFRWQGMPIHARLYALADGVCRGLSRTVADGRPLVLMMDGDIAKTLGRILRRELDVSGDIVAVDGVQLKEFDYLDIGEVIQPTNVVPLIIKSLLFSVPHGHSHGHSHDHDHDHDHGQQDAQD